MKSLAVCVMALISLDVASAAQRYVTPNGSTSSDCSAGSPCTLQRAADIVNPGDVVLVADGTYTTLTDYLLTISRGGTSTNKVTFKAVNRWGAKLWGQGGASPNGIRVEAAYVRIEGFDIYEFSDLGVYNASGSFFELSGNHIHHIGRMTCSNSTIGRDGYYSQGQNDIMIERNLFNDIGRLIPGENGCVTTAVHFDHGIYMSGSRVTIRNNVFYNMRTGWPIQLYPNPSSDVRIYANTFAGHIQDGEVGQIIIWPVCSNIDISNNIFYQTKGSLVHMGNSTTTGKVHNNLSDVAVSGIFDVAQSGVTTSGNLLNVSPNFVSLVVSGGIVSGTPDFHLRVGSPAIDAGLALADVPTDFDGNARPQGRGYDLGCFEYLFSTDVMGPAPILDLTSP